MTFALVTNPTPCGDLRTRKSVVMCQINIFPLTCPYQLRLTIPLNKITGYRSNIYNTWLYPWSSLVMAFLLFAHCNMDISFRPPHSQVRLCTRSIIPRFRPSRPHEIGYMQAPLGCDSRRSFNPSRPPASTAPSGSRTGCACQLRTVLAVLFRPPRPHQIATTSGGGAEWSDRCSSKRHPSCQIRAAKAKRNGGS